MSTGIAGAQRDGFLGWRPISTGVAEMGRRSPSHLRIKLRPYKGWAVVALVALNLVGARNLGRRKSLWKSVMRCR